MNVQTLYKGIMAISAKIDENKDYLVELDQQNGDGDLGISMSAGFRAVVDYLPTETETDLGKVCSRCGDHFNEAAPSSLGTILSFVFKGMARSLKGKTECTLSELAQAMNAGLENMMKKAGSKPGEKTILDALCPGVETLIASCEKTDALKLAAAAARAGSDHTRTMRAKWGRAAYYGENSIGILDGGSVVGALIFEALADTQF